MQLQHAIAKSVYDTLATLEYGMVLHYLYGEKFNPFELTEMGSLLTSRCSGTLKT
jgi:hypothetical protein